MQNLKNQFKLDYLELEELTLTESIELYGGEHKPESFAYRAGQFVGHCWNEIKSTYSFACAMMTPAYWGYK